MMTIKQLKSLYLDKLLSNSSEKVITTIGSLSNSAPSGLNDDCVVALAMAWDECSKMNGSPAVVITAKDPIEEIDELPYLE